MKISESTNHQSIDTRTQSNNPLIREVHVVFDAQPEGDIDESRNDFSRERKIDIINPDGYPKNIYIDPYIIQEATKEWGIGVKLELPRNVFHGTQPMEDYNQATRRYIEKQLQIYGKAYLQENPIIVIALPTLINGGDGTKESIILAIGDGHHRFRYSGGKKEFEYLPSIVFTPLQYAALYNLNKDPRDKITPEELELIFMQRIAEAKLSFEASLTDKCKPHPLPLYGIRTVEELQTLLDTPIHSA
ncbi:MAG: hypothetical protein KatS3mg089_0617 [Patescibacteria group bacterium]|nr:MAG: hypothetical protein KatS3mg089_0617 [Patescibacteria group bacterium]